MAVSGISDAVQVVAGETTAYVRGDEHHLRVGRQYAGQVGKRVDDRVTTRRPSLGQVKTSRPVAAAPTR
ncbi:hypothetical protein HR12_33875 [Microbacterium sp. SUBG005]|nr:hypothetical protein HR12_33875 [Microbacterium sp. SUBG005]